MPRPAPPCCPPKAPLLRRRALSSATVEALERAFRTLASATRIRILHVLCRERESSVRRLADRVGMKIAGVSNQLRLMAALGIVGSRREGRHVIYFAVDPCVVELLDTAACLARDSAARRRR